MTTTFPTTLDSYATVPQNQNTAVRHRERHQDVEDAVEALEAKVGVDDSAVPTSLDYRVAQLEDNQPTAIAFSFVPTVSFATPGDLAVVYTVQSGFGYRIGKLVYVNVALTFTPTYTTASGEFRILGLPFAAAAGASQDASMAISNLGTGWTWPASSTQLNGQIQNSASHIRVLAIGNGIAVAVVGAAHAPSGTAKTIYLSGVYLRA